MIYRARYYLERPTAGAPALILLRFSYHSKTVQVTTQEYVMPEHWDRTTQRVADQWIRANPDYLEINRILDRLDQFARTTYNQHRRDFKLKQLTPPVFKAMLQEQIGMPLGSSDAPSPVATYYATYCRQRENSGHLSWKTESSDRVGLRWFLRFAETWQRPIGWEDVNLQLFESYRDFFWSLPEKRTDSTVHKTLRKFKQVCVHAAAHGHKLGCDINAVRINGHLRLSPQAMETVAIYEDELERLADFTWPPDTGLTVEQIRDRLECRDLFVAACCTGLRVNRWPQIDRSNLIERNGRRMLSLFTKKGTRKRVAIPLSPLLERIGRRYDWRLPKHSPTIINRYIKEVCRLAGMTEEVELARNVRGRSVLQTFPKYELITTHTARRSFATNAHAGGVPLDDIQAMTGHSDRKTLLHYIKEDAERRAERLHSLPYYSAGAS